MKIIDLLNKIANGEEVPEKIIRNNDMIYEFHKNSNNYYEIENYEEPLFDEDITIFLNDEVEILEEEKKIPEKINTFEELTQTPANFEFNDILLADKLNEVIDYLKSKGE